MSQTRDLQTDLIVRCKKNDTRAQMQLYDMYCNAMFITAFNFIKREEVAEDLMQEAFLKAFQHLDSFDGKVTFGAWLKRIVINHCLDWLKKRKLRVVSIEDNYKEVSDEENWEVESSITIKQIHQAIEQLPEKYKIVLKLYLLEGYDHEEISQILNITTVSSRSQLHRAKNKLKMRLKNQCYA